VARTQKTKVVSPQFTPRLSHQLPGIGPVNTQAPPSFRVSGSARTLRLPCKRDSPKSPQPPACLNLSI
jgi:hypothetical protein